MLSVIVLVLLAFAGQRKASAKPLLPDDLVTRPPQTVEDRINYLIRYGHLTVEPNQMIDGQVLTKAIADLQRFAGIPVTGEMDEATDRLMAIPRCGVPDNVTTTSTRRRRRYVIQGSKWRRRKLTYLFQNYTTKLPTDVTKEAIKRALQLWSDVTPFDFAEAPPGAKKADIRLRFTRGDHGENSKFDGPGGVLAHAYFPSSGRTHFDDDEPWTYGVKSGVNLMQVATHEFGHTLGLRHSKVESSVMAPFYNGYDPNYALKRDDIDGIQSIYGKRRKSKVEVKTRQDSFLTLPSSSTFPTSSTTDNTPTAGVAQSSSTLIHTITASASTATRKDTTTKTMPTSNHTTTTMSSASPATSSTSIPTPSTTATTFPNNTASSSSATRKDTTTKTMPASTHTATTMSSISPATSSTSIPTTATTATTFPNNTASSSSATRKDTTTKTMPTSRHTATTMSSVSPATSSTSIPTTSTTATTFSTTNARNEAVPTSTSPRPRTTPVTATRTTANYVWTTTSVTRTKPPLPTTTAQRPPDRD